MSLASPTLPPLASLTRQPLGRLRSALGSRLAAALVSPHSVDSYLELLSPLWSIDRIRAEIVDATRETADVVTLVVRPNENLHGYKAGQHVAVTVEIDGAQHTRCFSLSSAPSSAHNLITLTIKARKRGLVSSYLLEHARPGMRLVLSEPAGDFVLPETLPPRILFISGGSGISPCMSMLRTLVASDYDGSIAFLHYAHSPEEVVFANELRDLAQRHPNLKLVIETETELGRLPSLDDAGLSAIAPSYERWDAWVCGPQSLMGAARHLYAERQASGLLRIEEFTSPTAVAFEGKGGELRFARSERTVQGDGRTLLEQAEAAGLKPKSGCRMGVCLSCRCKKLGGVTRDVRSGVVSAEGDTTIKLCVSAPVGDVTLDL
jgi:stearoyl-CoA 9-desaturase NADPH oxidoreductase